MTEKPEKNGRNGKAKRVGRPKQASKSKRALLREFGNYLRELRINSKIHTQAEAVVQLNKKGVDCSVSRLQQYEQGEINDPDKDVLRKMAEIYSGTDYWNLIDRLCREKYGLDPSHARLRSDEVGEVFVSPFVPIEQINAAKKRLVEGWFLLESTSLDEPYVDSIVNLVERGVKLTFWIRKKKEREDHRKAIRAALLTHKGEGADDHINTYLKYEDEPRIGKMFPESKGVASVRPVEAISEVYLFGGPQLDPDPLLAYWTLPGIKSVRALFVRLEEKLAKEHFEKHREFISKLGT